MIADWEQSELSQKLYCEKRQIAYHTFYYWLRRSKSGSVRKRSAAAFVKVSAAVSGQAELILPDGKGLICHHPVSAEFIKELLY
jgi:hypothetical protein